MAGALSLSASMDDDEASPDEYMAIEPIEGEIGTEIAEDGSLIVDLGSPDSKGPAKNEGFYQNLADGVIPEAIQKTLATDLIRKITIDKEARKKRDEQEEEGIRRTGLGKDAPGGADFAGASKVVHPGLTQGCIDFEARLMKELWPPSGPVKPRIIGKVTKEKDERAKRKTEYMNWQLTEQIKEAFQVTETTLTQVPLGGSQFIKLWQDERLRRPRMQFIPVDRVYIPDNAGSFDSVSRRTFVDYIDAVEFGHRVASGLYRAVKVPAPAMSPDKSKSDKATDKIEGKDDNQENVDGIREIYEVMSFVEITDEMATELDHEQAGGLYPYLISIDVSSQTVLSIYRDWEMDDPTFEPIEHLFEFPMIPWRGALSIGLSHIIGGLSGSATGALRALLDSAHINNTQGGFILKGSGTGGQSRTPQIGQFQELEGGAETPDIRAKVMPFASKEPSGVLFQLLGFLDSAQRDAVRTSLDNQAIDASTPVPVGTQLSRVEEGLVVFSQIHGRIHHAFNRLLRGLHRLNRMYMQAAIQIETAGREILVKRSDFEGPIDISPVSDPTVYSDQQRMGQIMAVQQRQTMVPGLYKPRAVEERFLKLLKVPDPSSLLVDAPQPHELNAVNENLAMVMGRPVVAFPEQDHLAHLQAHLDFMNSPILGQNPIIEPTFLPACLQHLREHIVYHYVRMTQDLVAKAANVEHAADLMAEDDHVKMLFDRLLAMASTKIVPATAQVFSKVLPILQQAMSRMKQYQPPQPMDPAQVAMQTTMADINRKGQKDHGDQSLANARLQLDAKNATTRAGLDQQRNAALMERNQVAQDNAALSSQTALERTAMDNDTARQIEQSRLDAGLGGGSHFKNAESLSKPGL